MKFALAILCLAFCTMHRALFAGAGTAPSDGAMLHPQNELATPPPAIASRLSTLATGMTRETLEKTLGSGWFEIGGPPNPIGCLTEYWNPTFPGIRIQAWYEWSEQHVLDDQPIRIAGPEARLLAPPMAIKRYRRPPDEVARLAEAMPLLRFAERMGLMQSRAASLDTQTSLAGWIAFWSQLAIVLIACLTGFTWRRNWIVVPVMGVIAAWVVSHWFQMRLLNPLAINYADSIGEDWYDGNAGNSVSLIFGWVFPAVESALFLSFLFCFRNFRGFILSGSRLHAPLEP